MAEANPTSVWRKSSRSANTDCLEVQIGPSEVLVRNSHDQQGIVLSFSYDVWRTFIAGAALGEFDLPNSVLPEQGDPPEQQRSALSGCQAPRRPEAGTGNRHLLSACPIG